MTSHGEGRFVVPERRLLSMPWMISLSTDCRDQATHCLLRVGREHGDTPTTQSIFAFAVLDFPDVKTQR